jgi:transposase-like protein
MEKYLDKITPQVSDTWRADELYLKVRGNTKYVYALMDDETRYWIAKEVADSKYTADIRPLFAKGKRIIGKKPKTLITDGAPNFHLAFRKEFADMRRYHNPLQIYHNFVRPHMGLDGKTPSEMAGIEVKGNDKWLTLIQNASKARNISSNALNRDSF